MGNYSVHQGGMHHAITMAYMYTYLTFLSTQFNFSRSNSMLQNGQHGQTSILHTPSKLDVRVSIIIITIIAHTPHRTYGANHDDDESCEKYFKNATCCQGIQVIDIIHVLCNSCQLLVEVPIIVNYVHAREYYYYIFLAWLQFYRIYIYKFTHCIACCMCRTSCNRSNSSSSTRIVMIMAKLATTTKCPIFSQSISTHYILPYYFDTKRHYRRSCRAIAHGGI